MSQVGQFGAISRDQQADIRQHGQRFDDQIVAFSRDEVADGKQGKDLQTQRLALGRAVYRTKPLQIDAIAQGGDALPIDTKVHHAFAQRLAHRDHGCCALAGPADELARYGMRGDQVDVGSASSDRHRFAEFLRQQDGCNAIRIKIMSVDGIEIMPLCLQTPDSRHC